MALSFGHLDPVLSVLGRSLWVPCGFECFSVAESSLAQFPGEHSRPSTSLTATWGCFMVIEMWAVSLTPLDRHTSVLPSILTSLPPHPMGWALLGPVSQSAKVPGVPWATRAVGPLLLTGP